MSRARTGTPAGRAPALRAAAAATAGAPAAAAGDDGGAAGADRGGAAPNPGPPAAPPRRADLLRVVDRVQKKDALNIFRDPVTDEVVRGPPPRRARPARLRRAAPRVRPTDGRCRVDC